MSALVTSTFQVDIVVAFSFSSAKYASGTCLLQHRFWPPFDLLFQSVEGPLFRGKRELAVVQMQRFVS